MADEQNPLNDLLTNATNAFGEIGNAHMALLNKGMGAFGSVAGNVLNGFTDFVKSFTATVTQVLEKVTAPKQ
ncbi:hypothetical protein Ctha_1146 [Chloroherpeton thalassium ATCC 35110]|uniref:Chlorosome envelope protein B n=1 Tax=Chloroherpeton thalassium (strain ATCC 35110 / GB-78) TaxID=517418 RepID=B3QYI2_CHLT3|nr:hypothetical protein [Chloroherpeton thalassium]ACF13610.1 hypothetical protein Ctha_1146 [Chloroherpeton thalassium ATCC 35110]